jgi:ABC-type nitrate/sulfonate/bicarbonate transport system substrate-binding protein
MQLVIRRAQGLPVLLVAPIFQQSGAAVYYRADSDFSSPAALVNARLGRLPASNILDIELATALRAEGIDPAKIKSVTLNADQIVPALADHQIDAAVGSAWIVPWQAHERSIVLKSFNPANYRVEY